MHPKRPTAAHLIVVALVAFVAVVAVLLVPAPVRAAPPPDGDAVLVKVAGGSAAAADAASAVDGAVERRVAPGVWKVRVPKGRRATAIARLSSHPRVAYAEPDHPVRLAALPNDRCFATPPSCGGVEQWNMRTVQAPAAWDITRGSSDVVVAVLDTGVQSDHHDLLGKVIPGGNHVQGVTSEDDNGHGTHVAGIVAAATDNGDGIAGLGWNTRVRAVKVLDADGAGSHSTVVAGIDEAIAAGVEVISMSFAGDESSVTLADAVARARNAGIVVVAAAGNGGDLTRPTYPANYPGVVSVAATDEHDGVAAFSRRGTWASIAAPGTDIVSTWIGDEYRLVSGTSMAAPHVAAAAALLFAAQPGITGAEVRSRLGATAVAVPGTGTSFQWGRLDVLAALRPAAPGYWFVASDGGVFAFGAAAFRGSAANLALTAPVVGMAATPTKRGYWLAASNGALFAYGDARHLGGLNGHGLNAPVLGVTAHPSGAGYWMVGGDGGVFSFGDARFHGSTGGMRLNQPVVGMTSTPTGDGYWMVARDGGVFAFGRAGFHGSTGGMRLNQPIVGMAATPSGRGYWLVAADGGIFAFGDAGFHGSMGGVRLNRPVVGMRATPSGKGYWLVASDGGVFAFGDATFLGSTGHIRLNRPIVGMAA